MGPHGNRRAPVHVAVAGGLAELRPDPARPQGWTLLVDGVPQSYVDLADPEYLPFPYERQLGTVMRSWSADRVRETVLHLGGGGLTLPRLLHHTHPGFSQVVVERDPAILALVSRFLPFPEQIEVRIGDARAELESVEPAGFGLIVSDVFVGVHMPGSVADVGFARAARRAIRPDGLLSMNLTDVPPLARTRIQAATARAAFDDVALYGDLDVVRGRRVGNVILLAGNVPMIKGRKHERVLRGDDLTNFIGGARPLLDEPR
jgi:spermidine synthase